MYTCFPHNSDAAGDVHGRDDAGSLPVLQHSAGRMLLPRTNVRRLRCGIVVDRPVAASVAVTFPLFVPLLMLKSVLRYRSVSILTRQKNTFFSNASLIKDALRQSCADINLMYMVRHDGELMHMYINMYM